MGLFNYIKVEQDLPLNDELKTLNIDFKKEEFQTKELEDNAMVTYIIRDNKLFQIQEEGHFEELPEDEKTKDSPFGFILNRKYVRDKREEIFREDYTGTFYFGCCIYGETIDATDFYPDWKCVVINGVIKEITIISEYSKHSSKDRIEQQFEWEKEKETHNRKMKCPVYNFYYNYYVLPLDRFGWYLSKKLYIITRFVEWVRFYGIRNVISFLTPR
jgi:hypothetical protein